MWVICSSWCCWSLSRERGGASVSRCCSAWLVAWGEKQGRHRVLGVLCTYAAWFHSGLSDLFALAGNSWIHTRGWSGCLKEHVKILFKMLTGWFQIDLAYCSVLNSIIKFASTTLQFDHHVCIPYSAIRSLHLSCDRLWYNVMIKIKYWSVMLWVTLADGCITCFHKSWGKSL
jgi:hypothetical protein